MLSELRKDCPMRHKNGNCLPAGGFCTAVNDLICEVIHNGYYAGRYCYEHEICIDALELINQQQKEIDDLRRHAQDWASEANYFENMVEEVSHKKQLQIEELEAEIKMLKKENETSISYLANLFDKYEKTKIAKDSLESTIKEIRVEVVKEFTEKLKIIGTQEGAYDYVSVFEIYEVAKEMGITYDEL